MKKNKEDQLVDRLRSLPECLLLQILLNLPTKDVVKFSVLSSGWRNVWKLVPGLELDCNEFPDYDAFASFIDGYLSFNSESRLQNFKLTCQPEDDLGRLPRWISTVIDRKVQHLHVSCRAVEIPQTVYTCESLVSLNLRGVSLADPKCVSLPCVKVLALVRVLFPTYLSLEMLISGCPLLKSFRLTSSRGSDEDLVVAIDAPRLEYLKIRDYYAQRFIIHSPGSLVEADIKNRFPPDNIRNFLIGISSVKVLKIDTSSLKAIYENSRCQPLPLFPNLTSLRVDFHDYRWEMLPIFLESCPNLKHLSLVRTRLLAKPPTSILSLLMEMEMEMVLSIAYLPQS